MKIASPFVSVFGKAKSAVVSLFSGIGDAIAKFEPITSKLGPIFSTFTSAMGTAASDAVGVITAKFRGSPKVGGALSATLSGMARLPADVKGITAATAGVAGLAGGLLALGLPQSTAARAWRHGQGNHRQFDERHQ